MQKSFTLNDAIMEWVAKGVGNRDNGLMRLAWACYHNGYTTIESLNDKLLEIWQSNFNDGNTTAVLNECNRAAMNVVGRAELNGTTAPAIKLPRKTEKQIQATAQAHGQYRDKWIEDLMMAHGAEITAPFADDEIAVLDNDSLTEEVYRDVTEKRLDAIKRLTPLEDGEYIFCGAVDMSKSDVAYMDRFFEPQTARGELWIASPLKEKKSLKASLKKVRYISAEIDEALYEPYITEPVGTVKRYAQIKREQLVFWNAVKDRLPIASIVDSGRKSLHVLLRVDTTTQEMERLRTRLVQIYTNLHIDTAGCTASQKTRTPWGFRIMYEGKNGELLKAEEVIEWMHDSDSTNLDAKFEAKKKLQTHGIDKSNVESKSRYVIQRCIFLDDKVKPMSLPELITALENIEKLYVPQVDNLAVKAKQDGKTNPYLSLELFRDFLDLNTDGKQPMKIWWDDITRAIVCEGFRTENPDNIVNCFKDAWHRYFDTDTMPTTEKIQMNISELAAINTTNPVTDWLETLQWDGKDRIAEAMALLGIEDDPFGGVLLHKWLLQCVAMAYNDGNQPFGADGVLTLYGKQGIGKTSFFKHLVPKEHNDDWWTGGMSLDTSNKDDVRKLMECWIGELGEVDSTLKREQSALKALITEGKDKIRLPYDRYPVKYRRHSSCCATVNSADFLKDTTGNRRWWVIEIKKRMDFAKIDAFDTAQLWAQIWQEYDKATDKAGCFRLTHDEQNLLNERNKNYTKMPEMTDLILEKYDFSSTSKRKWKSLMDITKELLHNGAYGGEIKTGELTRVGEALRALGLQESKRNGRRGYPMPDVADGIADVDEDEALQMATKVIADAREKPEQQDDDFFKEAPDYKSAKTENPKWKEIPSWEFTAKFNAWMDSFAERGYEIIECGQMDYLYSVEFRKIGEKDCYWQTFGEDEIHDGHLPQVTPF